MTDRSAEVEAWLDGRADEMATLVEALVRILTENPPGRELARCAGVLRDAMRIADRINEAFDAAQPSKQPDAEA